MRSFSEEAPRLARIARFIVDADAISIPDTTIHQGRRVLLDTLGVGSYGSGTPLYRYATQGIAKDFAVGPCQIWGSRQTLCATGAAFFNALAASATDFDDGHSLSVGHPASLVVPAALAVGKVVHADLSQILRAIITGYEVGTRFSADRKMEKVDTFSTGRWGGVAAATAAAGLLGLSVDQIMHALSLALILSPAMIGGHVDVSSGSMAKEGVAWAVQAGVQSALLARNGFTGPYLFLDQDSDYNLEPLLSELGNTWHIDTNYFKPYACCRWIHPALDACLEIRVNHQLSFEQIREVEVITFSRVMNLAQTRSPSNSTQAQFNLPFCVAAALYNGALLPEHVSATMLENQTILKLAAEMKIKVSETFDQQFPGKISSQVIIRTSNRTFESQVFCCPRWGHEHPTTDEELLHKFTHLTGKEGEKLGSAILQGEIDGIEELEKMIHANNSES